MSDELDNQLQDRLTAITRGAASLVPMVGGVIGEIATSVIPNQRLERVARYIRQLEKRIGDLEDEILTNLADDPRKVELIEEGGFQAARATEDDRISHIVEVVYNGLNVDDVMNTRQGRILRLLGEIDEDELAILYAYDRDSRAAWDRVYRPKPRSDPNSALGTQEEVESEVLFDAGVKHLLNIGLLRGGFVVTTEGVLPDWDIRAMKAKKNLMVSGLGRMLLRQTGLKP